MLRKQTVTEQQKKKYQAALKRNAYNTDSQVENLKVAYFKQRRVYKKLIKYKRHNFLQGKKTDLWNLKGEAPKEFGKKVKNGKEKHSLNFSNIELAKYFSTLLNSTDTRDSNEPEILARSIDTMTQNLIDESLTCDISLEEVKLMAKRLKCGKATRLDMLSAELLKHANENFMIVFTKLFNKLLQSGTFPEE